MPATAKLDAMAADPHQLTLHITGILGQSDTVNAYFLVANGEAVLVDTGRDAEADSQAILDKWRELGEPRMRDIVLTHGHPDHIGAAATLRERWQVPIRMHAGDLPILEHLGAPFAPDILLEDGDELNTPIGAATVIHTPGHSPGHVTLHFEGSGTLLSGDQVITNGTVYVGEPLGNMTQYLDSMRLLLRRDIRLLAPGHGPVVGDGWRHVLEMHEYRLRREGEIIMALRRGASTAEDVARAIYGGRELPPAIIGFGTRQTLCHLEHLERVGTVVRDGDNWVPKQ